MTDHALGVLEFGRVLEQVASRASSDAGRRRIRALRPQFDVGVVARELDRVAAAMRLVDASPHWAPGPIPDLDNVWAQLGVDGAVLLPLDVFRIGQLLTTSDMVFRQMNAVDEDLSALETIRERLFTDPELVRLIERSVDAEGEVLSTASADLGRVRARLLGARNRIVKQLESFLADLPARYVVPDASVTIRDGRFVIPVRREGKGEVGGIVHDESQTGATLYMEPPIAVAATNQLRELEREERREIHRVLSALTARFAPHYHDVAAAFDALVDFDTLFARARTAALWDAVPPSVEEPAPGRLVLREARHPLLLEASAVDVVPYDLTLGGPERCLVVSGPNTGGKSVFLKATGLIAALTQSGMVPPVGSGTTLPVFGSFFADIGDEQSIARNLSTFSAHLENLRGLLASADECSLILIDEMGTGTDPEEGAALSRAVLEELVERGATTLVSSHLGALKQLDTDGSGIVNASMYFDTESMEPTYRLTKGRPGRSYGLAIARRLGFPSDLLDRAESYRERGGARIEELLERLEGQEREVERLLHELDAERRTTDQIRSDVERRQETLRQAERTADERARSDARQLLMQAREEVESVIAELRAAAQEGRDLDEAARAARRRVERSAEQQRGNRMRPPTGTVVGKSGADASLGAKAEEGTHVRIRSTGAVGRVVENRGTRVAVEIGALRVELPADDVEIAHPPVRPSAARPRSAWEGKQTGDARPEVDLRGLRVDEMGLELQRALDHAVLDELEQIRIIHGMGTGALRKRVSEILELDRRVREFRVGGPGEGGAGVTVALLGHRA